MFKTNEINKEQTIPSATRFHTKVGIQKDNTIIKPYPLQGLQSANRLAISLINELVDIV